MLRVLPLLGAVLALACPAGSAPATPGPDGEAPGAAPDDPPAPLVIDRGPGELPLEVPAEEELELRVSVGLGLGRLGVGRVTLAAAAEPFDAGLVAAGDRGGRPVEAASGAAFRERPGRRLGRLVCRARGGHLGYTLDHRIETRWLPQGWPAVLVRDVQRGSESRRRELHLGQADGGSVADYHHDGHCRGCDRAEHRVSGPWPWSADRHCGGCKRAEHRVWRPVERRSVPTEAVDVLSAVWLARSFVASGAARARLAVADRDELWDVELVRGPRVVVETSAGRFACRRVSLGASAPPGEPEPEGGFRGLFGIHGDLRILVHEATGVPVRIEGDVPLGPLELGVRVDLERWRGAPAGFAPLAD